MIEDSQDKSCSNNSTFVVESAQDSPWPDYSQEDLNLSNSVNGISGAEISLKGDILASQSQKILKERIKPDSVIGNATENTIKPISSPRVPPANRSVSKENGLEQQTNEIVCQPSSVPSEPSVPNTSVSKTYPDSYLALFNRDYPKEVIGKFLPAQSQNSITDLQRLNLEVDILPLPSVENGYCWLEAPTALSHRRGRPPGLNKLEHKLKQYGILKQGEVLNPDFLSDSFNLPKNYLDPSDDRTAAQLLDDNARQLEIFSTHEWPQSPSTESSTSTVLQRDRSQDETFTKIEEILKEQSDCLRQCARRNRFSFSTQQREFFETYLYQAFGVHREETLAPAITCFVNAQARAYNKEVNNISGDIQFSPLEVRKRGKKCQIREDVPSGVNTVNLAHCRLLFDSGAFPEVRLNRRLSPEEALNRQLSQLSKFPVQPQETWLVSYDRLIDEKYDGNRKKERWSVSEASKAVQQTVEAAQYLHSQRERLKKYTLVQSCQGVDAAQYRRCVEYVLKYCVPGDVLGLGGWCILGKQKKWLPTFYETISQIIPLIAEAGLTKVHIFGVTWWKEMRGFKHTPLGSLLWLCDQHGLQLSCDGRSPIGNALWNSKKSKKKAGALHPHWRVNLALTRTRLATLREQPEYQAPPGYLDNGGLFSPEMVNPLPPVPTTNLNKSLTNTASAQSVELSPPTHKNKSLTKTTHPSVPSPTPQTNSWESLPVPHGGSRGRGRPKGSRNKQAPSGSLTPIVERRQGKIYPLVGERVPKDLAFDYPEQYFWLYQWCVWDGSKWMTKSKRVKCSRVHSVKYLIGRKRAVSEILHFIQTGKMPEL